MRKSLCLLMFAIFVSFATAAAPPEITASAGYLESVVDFHGSLSDAINYLSMLIRSAAAREVNPPPINDELSLWNSAVYSIDGQKIALLTSDDLPDGPPAAGWRANANICSGRNLYISGSETRIYASFESGGRTWIYIGQDRGTALCDFIGYFVPMYDYFNTSDVSQPPQFPAVLGVLSN